MTEIGSILVIDDEENIRKALKIFLESHCYNVNVCQDGESAIKRIKNENFDLVITDYKMKKLNGLDVLQEVKRKNKNIPVILVSMYFDEMSAEDYDKTINNADGYIRKPFDLSDVLTMTNKLINKQEVRVI